MKLLKSGVLAMALALGATHPAVAGNDSVIVGPTAAVVDTRTGRVQGFIRNGIFTYRGIPYAKAGRFQPPQPVAGRRRRQVGPCSTACEVALFGDGYKQAQVGEVVVQSGLSERVHDIATPGRS